MSVNDVVHICVYIETETRGCSIDGRLAHDVLADQPDVVNTLVEPHAATVWEFINLFVDMPDSACTLMQQGYRV